MPSKRIITKAADQVVKRRKSPRLGSRFQLQSVEVKIEEEVPVKEEEVIKTETRVKTEAIKREDAKEVEVKEEETCSTEVSPINGTCFSTVKDTDLAEGQPKNWQHIYNEIIAMRAKIVTPVDSMGCEKMPDTLSPALLQNQPQLYRFQLLILLISLPRPRTRSTTRHCRT